MFGNPHINSPAYQMEPEGFQRNGNMILASYLTLPKPTCFWVLIINPNMEFIGTLQKSRFWWVRVHVQRTGCPIRLAIPVLGNLSFGSGG